MQWIEHCKNYASVRIPPVSVIHTPADVHILHLQLLQLDRHHSSAIPSIQTFTTIHNFVQQRFTLIPSHHSLSDLYPGKTSHFSSPVPSRWIHHLSSHHTIWLPLHPSTHTSSPISLSIFLWDDAPEQLRLAEHWVVQMQRAQIRPQFFLNFSANGRLRGATQISGNGFNLGIIPYWGTQAQLQSISPHILHQTCHFQMTNKTFHKPAIYFSTYPLTFSHRMNHFCWCV